MNKMRYIKTGLGVSLSILLLAGCKKDFLGKPPTDAIVDAGFYKSDEQVMAGTSLVVQQSLVRLQRQGLL